MVHPNNAAVPELLAADAALVVLMFCLLFLLGPILTPILTRLGALAWWLSWRLIVIVSTLIRDEMIKTILLALAAWSGLAGLFRFFG